MSILLNVFAIGLSATLADTTYLFRRPVQLGKALLSMNVVMLVFAPLMVTAFDLHPALKIALVALSVSPIPPLLSKKALQAGGRGSYTIGLFVAVSLLAIVVVPAALELIESLLTVPLGISPGAIALVVLTTALAPLAVGIAVHRLAPRVVETIAAPLAWVATVMLLASVLPLVITAFPVITSLIGNGTMVALVAFVVVGLAAGHLLGGPDAEDRTVLALSTTSRHPAIAMAIAHINFPEQKLAMAAVLLYLIVNGIVALPYLHWTKRRHSPGPDRKNRRIKDVSPILSDDVERLEEVGIRRPGRRTVGPVTGPACPLS